MKALQVKQIWKQRKLVERVLSHLPELTKCDNRVSDKSEIIANVKYKWYLGNGMLGPVF